MYNEMGWKMRKDKLQSDEPETEGPQDQYAQEQEQAPEIEADASAMARLAQLSADIEPSAFVLDLDKDSFRTDTKRTSLDPNEFGWFNESKPDANAQKPTPPQPASPAFGAPSFDSPAFNTQSQGKASGYAEPAFDTVPNFELQSPAFKPAQEEAPARPRQSGPNPAFDEPAPAPKPSAPEEPAWTTPQPSWTQEPAPATPPPAFADPSAGQAGAPFAPASQPQNGRPAPQQAAYEPAVQSPFAPIADKPSGGPFADPAPTSQEFTQQQAPYQPAPQAPASAAPRSPYINNTSTAPQASPYASQPPRSGGDGQNINSFTRESVAPGLVSGEGEFSIPKVAPFIVAGTAPQQEEVVATTGDHYLILRIRNLSSSYKLTKDVTTIGRPDSMTKNYPDVEIELDDGVSRKHAEIRHKNGEFYVVDVGSTNGTLLNGDLMDVNVEMKLAHGDRIRVGEKTEIVFE